MTIATAPAAEAKTEKHTGSSLGPPNLEFPEISLPKMEVPAALVTLTSDETQTIGRVREQVRKQMEVLTAFDYGAPAELFPCRGKNKRGEFKYKRFDTAAEAIRFAVEDVSARALLGACLEVDEARFGHHEIHYLYENAAYPLKRCGADVRSENGADHGAALASGH